MKNLHTIRKEQSTEFPVLWSGLYGTAVIGSRCCSIPARKPSETNKSISQQINKSNQNTEKSKPAWLIVWASWAENKNFETNLLTYEAKQLDENKYMALDDWISLVVV